MVEHWIKTDFRFLPLVWQYNDLRLTNEEEHRIGVIAVKDGEPVALEGDVSANVIKPDNGTIVVNGEKDGNTAWIVLPEEAYEKEGKISVFIRLTNGEEVATIGGFEAYIA